MPNRAATYCPACKGIVRDGQCSVGHGTKDRPHAAARGYDYRWQQARAKYLAQHPFCVACEADGSTTVATVVDHIRPHKGSNSLFWDVENWQALCERCHNKKTAGGG